MISKEKREILPIRLGGATGILLVRIWAVSNPRGRVICTHGIGSSGAEFAILASRLNSRGFDVVCPDWLGHGESQYLWREGAYRWEFYVRCLAAVARKYHAENLHFVGVSWGGMMLLLYLLASRSAMRSAVFVDVPLCSNPALAQSAGGLRVQAEAAFDSVEEIETFLYRRRPELRATPPEWQDYLRRSRFVERDGKYVMRFDPAAIAILEQYGAATFDNFRALPRVECEALFLYGILSPYRDPVRFAPVVAQQSNLVYSDTLDSGHPPALFGDHETGPIVKFIERASDLVPPRIP